MDIVIRSVAVFVAMWVVLRLGGKREVAQLSAFDMILLVTLGDLVSQGVLQEDYSLTAVFIAVSTITVAGFLLALLGVHVPRSRPVLGGEPRIVVRDGEPVLEALRTERLTLDDLNESARQRGIRSLREIELCVLETDGTFSFFTSPDDGGTSPHGDERERTV